MDMGDCNQIMINLYGTEVKLTKEREGLLEGGWEAKRIRSMLANITSNDIVFDIGAEQGDMSVVLGKKAKEIHLFEPSPIMWPHIRSNFQRNGVKLGGYFAGLVSDEISNPTLDYDDEDAEGFPACAYEKIDNVRGFRHLYEHAQTTKQTTIDAYCEAHDVYPTVVTIDVEGAEWHVLQGMRNTIDKVMPIIYVSVHDELMWNLYKKWFHDIWWEYMRELGYKVEFLGHDHESHFVFYKKSLLDVKEII